MNEARYPTTQKILDLTLEIIYLLTGEDHMMMKIHEMVSDSSRHQISEGHDRSQSFNTEPPPHSGIHEQNHEKILELSNQIIRLLTGEVPIRCEDVTVYLSMEEWEYVERHKELYEDVMMEDHQPVDTLGNSLSGEFHSPASLTDFRSKNRSENITNNGGKCLESNNALKGRAESAGYAEREFRKSLGTNIDLSPLPEHTQSEYPSANIKEESPTYGEGNLTDSDMYEPPEHTQTEYPSTDIKEESPTYGGGNLTDTDMYEPLEHTQTVYTPGNAADYLTSNESRKSNRCIYHDADSSPVIIINTDLIPNSSLYKENSITASELQRESHSESTQLIHDTNGAEEGLSSDFGENCTHRLDHNHEKVHTEENPTLSSEREERYTGSVTFKEHQRIHAGIKLSRCTECGKCFPLPSALVRHQRIHTGEKPYKCDACGKCFTQASHLKSHRLIHTGEKPFKCSDCGKGFFKACYLAKHCLVHSGDKPFKCPDCGKSFTWSSQLAAHKWVHTGEKPFSCSDCCKRFSIKSQLHRHLKTHTGEKPFECRECGKCFINASHLSTHSLTHSGEKPFKCPECGKCYTRAHYLAIHKMIHTGEKPFSCSECEKCFSNKHQLQRHLRIHTPKKALQLR